MEFARDQVKSGLFSITGICRLCGISKNTYYHHKHPDERFVLKYESIRGKIKKVIEKDSSYGVKRIKQELWDRYKIEIGRDALGRLLRLWSLNLKRNIRKVKKSIPKKILEKLSDKVNLLIRTEINKPFQAITSDITEIIYNHGKSKVYLAVHKDVFGQMVYGWEIAKTMEAKLVINSFQKAVKSIRKLIGAMPEKLLCHQDQGSQYTGYDYIDMVLKNEIILSYSTPGTPTENPGQESFFGRLKDEKKHEFLEMETFEEIKKLISKRINYYNNERLHTSINLKSPKIFTLNFIKNFSK